ncbi:hypothetical protein GALMADRAFT_65132 [Galerina marginata CBS 339.88]|uniref:Uncharacterized protein n=1 Tax=Galerina marginata (strain CBS 339.88) TaxID=685588 RepID=A0A067T551_GALM3|nr:hypothetical protein GALMADRAFT_65132 [Galerina marginata CBS 339.88]
MATTIADIPSEILQKIALFATVGSPLGPPKELLNLLLTCRTFRDCLSAENAGELYYVVFSSKFDARGPLYRLSPTVVREHAPLEMRRRFSAIKIFKRRLFDHPRLTEALWVAYLMVEDSDTSQKNVKQLLSAGVPSFLDLLLRRRLYEGSADNQGWPIMNERISLAIALSWTLASQRVMSYENPERCQEMMRLLRPIIFAAFRYSTFHTAEELFSYGSAIEARAPQIGSSDTPYPPSILSPQEIEYFGAVKRKARPPSAAIFAALLYFTRMESRTTLNIPPHITCETREEAIQNGTDGPCADDIRHFYHHCRTHFADFPGIDVGIQSSAIAASPDTILCQPSSYKLGTLTGQWQGSDLTPCIQTYHDWQSTVAPLDDSFNDTRKALYITLEEHYCYDIRSAVPMDDKENGSNNAWLPTDLVATETDVSNQFHSVDGMEFTDSKGSFRTTYETVRGGQSLPRGSKQIVDIILTGKTEEQYRAAWGGYGKILGRVRLHDGLMVLIQSNPDDTIVPGTRVLRGYVTSSQNLVGRLRNPSPGADLSYEGVFSLSKSHTGPSQSLHQFN